jgi:hypothetical protein
MARPQRAAVWSIALAENPIDRALLVQMFDAMREEGSIDVDAPCVWGFYFVDADRDKLEAAGRKLEELGYDVVDVYPNRAEDDEDGEHVHDEHCRHGHPDDGADDAADGFQYDEEDEVEVEDEDADEGWVLNVERIERHTVDSLHRRNQELADFAEAMNIAEFDGMDCGPVEDESDEED